jgi:hypothetical protein
MKGIFQSNCKGEKNKMKKLIIGFLFMALLLTGCNMRPTKVVEQLQYVESIKTSRGEILMFKDKEGYKINYFVDPKRTFYLQSGKKYDVKVSVESILQYGDFIEDAQVR